MIQKLGKYKILDKLGEGAMGSVYRAYDNILDRDVAIKIMAEDIKWNPELKLRFYREARSAAGLHHPNIVTIYDLGEEGKTTFIVMEHLEGKNLKQMIQENLPMPLEKKLSIIAQVSDGLNHAHQSGLIHRDIKPANIFVTTLGNVKILDFGIARIPASSLTRVGDKLGTPIYMSPELVRGVDYDSRSDIFSAGIVFYEFLTHSHPFRDNRFDKTLNNIVFKKDLPFAEQFPDAPDGLWPILNKCLAKEPENRYANMGEAVLAIRSLIEHLNQSSLQMVNRISALLPNLRMESQKQDAPPSLTRLWAQAQDLLAREQKPDYLALLRLTNSFNEEPLVQAIAGSMAPPVHPREDRADQGISAAPTEPHEASIRTDARQPAAGPPGAPETESQPPFEEAAASPQEEQILDEDKLRGRKMLADAEKLLDEKRLDEALDLLREALGPLGPDEHLVRTLAETRRKIEERNSAQVRQSLEAAKQAVEARQFQIAVEALDKVLELEPGKADAIEMRRTALAQMEAEKAARMRKEEGERNKASGFRLLAEKKYGESLRTFKAAADLLGEDETIRIGIEESEEGLRAEKLRADMLSGLRQAHKLYQSGDLTAARAAVQEALELSPRNAEAKELLAEIEKAQKEKDKNDAIASLAAQSREAMTRKQFGEAISLANEALEKDPDNAQILNLLQSIDDAKEKMRRRQEAEEIFVKIEESISRRDYAEAETRLHSALAVVPGDPVALEYLQRINSLKEEQQKAKEIDKAVAEAAQALEKGDLEQCERRARHALALGAQESRARELLDRVGRIRVNEKREKIDRIIGQGRDALQTHDFDKATACANELLQMDPQNEDAQKLLSEIRQTKSDRLQARIAELLSLSRDAVDRDQYDEATAFAEEILALDGRHKEAKSLIKTIGRARRNREKQLRKQQREFEKAEAASYPAPAEQAAAPEEAGIAGEETALLPAARAGKSRRILAWSGIGIVCILLLAGGAYWITHRPTGETPPLQDLSLQVNEAKSYLDQKKYDKAVEAAQKVLDSSPSDARAQDILSEAQKAKSAIEFHMLNAQSLRDQSQLEAALDAIWKVLEIDSSYQPAIQVREQIQGEIDERDKKLGDDARFRQYLARASSLLAACKLEESETKMEAAGNQQGEESGKRLQAVRKQLDACSLDRAAAEINRARKINPGDKQVASLAAELARKKSEHARIEKELGSLLDAKAAQSRIAEMNRQAESLFKEAKYAECENILNHLLTLAPGERSAGELKAKLADARSSIQSYEDALAAKRPRDALNALARLEEANPSNPNLPAYRQRAENLQKVSKATLTILRKNEPASLVFDGEPIGTNGEVLSEVVSSGPHTLVIKNKRGNQKSFPLDFFDGQNSTYAYGSDPLEFGAMTKADRQIVENRRELETVHQFMVERSRGWLKGSDRGELLISGFEVEYVPANGDDGDKTEHAFADLELKVDGENLKFAKISENKEFGNFKAKNKKTAESIKELWDNLKNLSRQ